MHQWHITPEFEIFFVLCIHFILFFKPQHKSFSSCWCHLSGLLFSSLGSAHSLLLEEQPVSVLHLPTKIRLNPAREANSISQG